MASPRSMMWLPWALRANAMCARAPPSAAAACTPSCFSSSSTTAPSTTSAAAAPAGRDWRARRGAEALASARLLRLLGETGPSTSAEIWAAVRGEEGFRSKRYVKSVLQQLRKKMQIAARNPAHVEGHAAAAAAAAAAGGAPDAAKPKKKGKTKVPNFVYCLPPAPGAAEGPGGG